MPRTTISFLLFCLIQVHQFALSGAGVVTYIPTDQIVELRENYGSGSIIKVATGDYTQTYTVKESISDIMKQIKSCQTWEKS